MNYPLSSAGEASGDTQVIFGLQFCGKLEVYLFYSLFLSLAVFGRCKHDLNREAEVVTKEFPAVPVIVSIVPNTFSL